MRAENKKPRTRQRAKKKQEVQMSCQSYPLNKGSILYMF